MAGLNLIPLVALALVLVAQCCFAESSNLEDDFNLPTEDKFNDQFHVRVREAILKLDTKKLANQLNRLLENRDEHRDIYEALTESPPKLGEVIPILKSILAQQKHSPKSPFGIAATEVLKQFRRNTGEHFVYWCFQHLKSDHQSEFVIKEFNHMFEHAFEAQPQSDKFFEKLEKFNLAADNLDKLTVDKKKSIFSRKHRSERFEAYMDSTCNHLEGEEARLKLVFLHLINSIREVSYDDVLHRITLESYYKICQTWWDPTQRNLIKQNMEVGSKLAKLS